MDIDEADPDLREEAWRWPLHLRVQMVRAYLSGLTWEQAEDVYFGRAARALPPNSKLEAIYDELQAGITTDANPDWDGQGVPESRVSSRRAIKDATKMWAMRFLECGSILDKPPHEKGWRLAQNEQPLAAIRELLLRGWEDDNGDVHVYRSLKDLQARAGAQFEVLWKQTGLKDQSLDTLWNQLKRRYPRLNKVRLRLKKQRDHVQVQVCAFTVMRMRMSASRPSPQHFCTQLRPPNHCIVCCVSLRVLQRLCMAAVASCVDVTAPPHARKNILQHPLAEKACAHTPAPVTDMLQCARAM